MSFINDKLLNLIRAQAAGVLSQFTHLRVGTISAYDPDTYSASVVIQPEGILTGNLPILTPWMGHLWGLYAPPTPGDSVVVHFMEGSLSVGFVGERIFTTSDHPIFSPGPPSGEFWLVHKTGTFLKFLNTGVIQIQALDIHGSPTNINIAGNLIVTGNIQATGDILDKSATNTDNMAGMRSVYNSHTHGGVSAGGSNTAVPNQDM